MGCVKCSERKPVYAEQLCNAERPELLTFECDGKLQTRPFKAWGLRVLGAWSLDPSACIEVVDDVLTFRAQCGTKVFAQVVAA